MKTKNLIALVALSLLLVACKDNPVDHDDGEEAYTATLSVMSDHPSTLTDIEFEVEVADHHGNHVSTLTGLAVEYRAAGSPDWRARELELHGDHYTSTLKFYSSGQYDLRVTRTNSETDPIDVLYESATPIDVERIHQTVGDYIVAFESYPGHIHEGDTATLMFYVSEGHHGGAQPGLTGEVVCTESNLAQESHAASESSPGEYEAHHTFQEAGDFMARFQFQTSLGQQHAQFVVPISHRH